MQFSKFLGWSKFTARICQNQQFKEKCPTHFYRYLSSKEICKLDQKLNWKQHGYSNWGAKISDFKSQMAGCRDPVKKYNLLVALRDHNLDIYYRYLCDNTAEVLSVLFSVDAAIDDFCRMGTMISNNLKTKRKGENIKQLDVANTVDFLRQRINDQKEAKFPADLKTELKTSSTNKTDATMQHFMIYMEKNQNK